MKPQTRQALGILCVAAAALVASFVLAGMAPDLAVVVRYAAGLAAVIALALIGLELTRD